MSRFNFVLLGCVALTQVLNAQFYAPDVCLHDAAQRLFVVEAARVHAWLENQREPAEGRVSGVRWTVEGKLNGDSDWKVTWLDAEGKESRQIEISYGLAELGSGADFYRKIWKAICAGTAKRGTRGDAGAMLAKFWPEPEGIGLNRMSGVLAAGEWARLEKPATQAEDAVALSGLLIHSAMPILTDSCQLDYLLLARGAVWLCHAEEMAGVQLASAWAPLMYLAGREKLAALLWQSGGGRDDSGMVVRGWWERVLGTWPTPMKELVLFAAEEGNESWGLAFIMAHLQMDRAHATEMTKLVPLIYGKRLNDWHDLGPVLIKSLGVTGPQDFYANMATLARLSWLQTLGHVASPEAEGSRPELTERAVVAIQSIPNDSVQDPGCKGLAAAAELINLGEKAAADLLPPIGAVSAEDLLVFGWDMTVHTMEAWMHFLNSQLGVVSQARIIRDACIEAVPSLAFWVDVIDRKTAPKYGGDWRRLEFFQADKLARPAVYWFVGGQDNAYSDPVPVRPPLRNWLKRGMLGFYHAVVVKKEAAEGSDFWQWIDLILEQGGECHAVELYRFLNRPLYTDENAQDRVPAEVLQRLNEATPNAAALHRSWRVLASRVGKGTDFMENAQELEKSYWQAPGSDVLVEIFEGYLKANALDAAKRFYAQVLPMVGQSVQFSNEMATRRWALACWENDREAMAAAARDAPSFSALDVYKKVMHLILNDEIEEAERLIEAANQRYPSREPDGRTNLMVLQDFLPLLEALKKTGHPEREKALAHFGEGASWLILRFALARKFELSGADGSRFLGGVEQKSLVGRVICAYWEKDDAAFSKAFLEAYSQRARSTMPFDYPLMYCLFNEMKQRPAAKSQPDLRPAEVRTLDQLVLERWKEVGRRR